MYLSLLAGKVLPVTVVEGEVLPRVVVLPFAEVISLRERIMVHMVLFSNIKNYIGI